MRHDRFLSPKGSIPKCWETNASSTLMTSFTTLEMLKVEVRWETTRALAFPNKAFIAPEELTRTMLATNMDPAVSNWTPMSISRRDLMPSMVEMQASKIIPQIQVIIREKAFFSVTAVKIVWTAIISNWTPMSISRRDLMPSMVEMQASKIIPQIQVIIREKAFFSVTAVKIVWTAIISSLTISQKVACLWHSRTSTLITTVQALPKIWIPEQTSSILLPVKTNIQK